MELLKKIYVFYETYCIPKRWDILTRYIKKYNIKTFIEIGVWTGDNLDNMKMGKININKEMPMGMATQYSTTIKEAVRMYVTENKRTKTPILKHLKSIIDNFERTILKGMVKNGK